MHTATFMEGTLCWLHQPEQLKINPRLCSPFFGPWVFLSLVGDTNAVIQHLANKKTRYVNINRLHHYNLQNKDFGKHQHNQPNVLSTLKNGALSSNNVQLQTKGSAEDF